MKNESIVSPRLQKAVKKLMAEEYYAAQYYSLAPYASSAETRAALDELFASANCPARFARLAQWAEQYGVDVPCSDAEMRKCAGGDLVRKAQGVKRGQDALAYVGKAAAVEEAAMKSYKEAIESEGVSYFTDLQSILWQNYYDRADVASKLQTATAALEAGCDLIMN